MFGIGKTIPSKWSTNECAGLDWTQSFMKRYRNLSLRKDENASLFRATSFNKNNVEECFNNLHSVMDKYRFKPECILI